MKSALFCVGMLFTGIDLHGIAEMGIPRFFFFDFHDCFGFGLRFLLLLPNAFTSLPKLYLGLNLKNVLS